MKFANIVKWHKSNIAFIVGNGINRFDSTASGNSWDELLVELWNKYSPSRKTKIPAGISLAEFYDVLELQQNQESTSNTLQKEFCNLMVSWAPSDHHKAFIDWASLSQSPVLTSNFENTLGEAGKCQLHRFRHRRFTDFYPWESYYSNAEITDPENNFAIWHVNGMQRYHRSIRLGLTHYMGSVARARRWLHGGSDQSLFLGNRQQWYGANSWLQIVFNKPLAIFGLTLGRTEVFLRWLLIERAKYFLKFPERRTGSWYLYTDESLPPGKAMFFKYLGISPVKVNSYEELYIDPW